VVVVLITGYSFGAEFYDPEDELLRPDLMMQKPYPNFEKFKTILLELIAKRRLRFPLPPQDSVPAPPAIVPPPQEKKPPIPEDQPEDERVEPASALKVEKPPGTGELKTVL
jgi:hypothetical protein